MTQTLWYEDNFDALHCGNSYDDRISASSLGTSFVFDFFMLSDNQFDENCWGSTNNSFSA